jgi:hypothetical protein
MSFEKFEKQYLSKNSKNSLSKILPALSQFLNKLVALQHTSPRLFTGSIDRIKTLIYQQRSKEMANHSRNGRNGSAKGKILPLNPKSRALNVEKMI